MYLLAPFPFLPFCREEVAPDATKDGPLCMNQYARLFGHARIPAKNRDLLVRLPPCCDLVSLP